MHRAAQKKKPLAALEKRVPKNPKYADIRARIDSGLTMDKVRVVTTREYLRRRTETFCRVSPAQLHELFTEYEDDIGEQGAASRAPAFDGPRIVTHEVEDKPEYQRPYLILDLRTPHEFQHCHILQARNFPYQHLNQDKISADLLRYKNREGHLIVLYDEEERVSAATATQFIEKGFLNVYVLSGGLESFSEDFPAYVEGGLPEALLSKRRSQLTHTHERAAAAHPPVPLSLSEGLSRLNLSASTRYGSRRPSAGHAGHSQANDDARSDITSMVSVSSSSRHVGHHPPRAQAQAHGYASSTMANTARSMRGAGSEASAPPAAASSPSLTASASSWALRRALGRRRPSSLAQAGAAHMNMSTASNVTVADSVISRAQAKRGSF